MRLASLQQGVPPGAPPPPALQRGTSPGGLPAASLPIPVAPPPLAPLRHPSRIFREPLAAPPFLSSSRSPGRLLKERRGPTGVSRRAPSRSRVSLEAPPASRETPVPFPAFWRRELRRPGFPRRPAEGAPVCAAPVARSRALRRNLNLCREAAEPRRREGPLCFARVARRGEKRWLLASCLQTLSALGGQKPQAVEARPGASAPPPFRRLVPSPPPLNGPEAASTAERASWELRLGAVLVPVSPPGPELQLQGGGVV